jgi:hypothetical protein
VIVIAISGNLSRYFQLKPNFTYNYDFIPIAATVIYAIALGLPLGLKFMMRFMGCNFFNGTFIEVCLFSSLFVNIDRGHIWV